MNHQTKPITTTRIIMAVTNDLVTDQRVHRACTALHQAGFDVTLVGRLLRDSPRLDRDYPVVRMRLLFSKKIFFYAEYNFRLFFRLLFSRSAIFYANDTDTLPACYLAARLRRMPLFFDAHELFPEVPELVCRPRVKRFWENIESFILPRMAKRNDMAAATVCQSIADLYYERYGLKMAVVRNVPMRTESHDADISPLLDEVPQGRKLLLYQGSVNLGRGIEAVMDAMPLLPECHFLIAGVGDLYDDLRVRAQRLGCDNITFLGRLEPSVLKALTKHADLGISLLENRGLNYYFSLPNRIADFVHAGVPILATDFPEIHRVVSCYRIGTLVPPAQYDPATKLSQWPTADEMASIIRNTLAHWDAIPSTEKATLFAKAASDLCWDNDKNVLLNKIRTILSSNPS